jgi:hypothetical protein
MHCQEGHFINIFYELVCKIDFCANIGRKHLYVIKWVIFGSSSFLYPPI